MAAADSSPQTTRNRNHFPFLELPAELRLSIYHYAIGPEVYIKPYVSIPRLLRLRLKGPYALLCVSRQVNNEVEALLYAKPTFTFGEVKSLRTFFHIVNPEKRKNLRIRLEFKDEEWFEFFHKTASTGHSAALILRTLNLKSLELCFMEPSDLDFRYDDDELCAFWAYV